MGLKQYLKIFLLILILCNQNCFINAHSGRTDSSGGHRDNKNKSGLGSYHYHCGGNPPHLHTNGCPYDSSNNTSSNSSSESSSNNNANSSSESISKGPSKESIIEKATSDGYSDGYNLKESQAYSYTGEFESEYQEAYKVAFENGKAEIEKDIYNAKEKGYEDGKNNIFENIYKQETLVKSYQESYDKGNKEFIENKKIEYAELGEKDCIENKKDRTFGNEVDAIFVEAYNTAYKNKYSEIKKEEYKLKGYEDGIINKINENIPTEYAESYNEGNLEGKKERETILEDAFSKGYEGTQIDIEKKFEPITEEINKQYSEGKNKKKKEIVTKSIIVGSIIILGIYGIYKYSKIKSKKND